MILPVVDSFLIALGKGFDIWDHYNKTRYAREFSDIKKSLYDEYAKPIYPEEGKEVHYTMLRNQAKIDELQHDLSILIERFLKEKPNYESQNA